MVSAHVVVSPGFAGGDVTDYAGASPPFNVVWHWPARRPVGWDWVLLMGSGSCASRAGQLLLPVALSSSPQTPFCQGGVCRGVIDMGLQSVVVDCAKEALCRLRRTRR